jgi:hypothetical protein
MPVEVSAQDTLFGRPAGSAPLPTVTTPGSGCCSCCTPGQTCIAQCCSCTGSGPVTAPAPGAPAQPGTFWDRIGDVLGGLGGGGGVLTAPQPQQQTLAIAPTEGNAGSKLAIVLVLGGLGAGGYYFYKRQKA